VHGNQAQKAARQLNLAAGARTLLVWAKRMRGKDATAQLTNWYSSRPITLDDSDANSGMKSEAPGVVREDLGQLEK
jgi:hypothetical protein